MTTESSPPPESSEPQRINLTRPLEITVTTTWPRIVSLAAVLLGAILFSSWFFDDRLDEALGERIDRITDVLGDRIDDVRNTLGDRINDVRDRLVSVEDHLRGQSSSDDEAVD